MTNVDQTAHETTALCMHPDFEMNANDVAHAATFPPAAFQRGGRHRIRPLGRGTDQYPFTPARRRSETTPLYT